MVKIDLSKYTKLDLKCGPGTFLKLILSLDPSKNILLITTPGFFDRHSFFCEHLKQQNIHILSSVTSNPSIDFIFESYEQYKNIQINKIIAVGGGSVLDVAKILSTILSNPLKESVMDGLNTGIVKDGSKKIPLTLVPTTCGSGAEITHFSTLWNYEEKKKLSIEGEALLPSHVVYDPILLRTLPSRQILFSGLDTISHSLESLWNINRTKKSEELAKKSLKISLDNIELAIRHPGNIRFLYNLQIASTLAGLAIAKTRTAIAHSISYPLTINFNVPHGLACSFLLDELIVRHLDSNPEEPLKNLLIKINKLIKRLELNGLLNEYFCESDIRRINKDDFYNAGRATNYSGSDFDVYLCIEKALRRG